MSFGTRINPLILILFKEKLLDFKKTSSSNVIFTILLMVEQTALLNFFVFVS